MSHWTLWLCIVLLIGSTAASDVPFVFGEIATDVAGYSSKTKGTSTAAADPMRRITHIQRAQGDIEIKTSCFQLLYLFFITANIRYPPATELDYKKYKIEFYY